MTNLDACEFFKEQGSPYSDSPFQKPSQPVPIYQENPHQKLLDEIFSARPQSPLNEVNISSVSAIVSINKLDHFKGAGNLHRGLTRHIFKRSLIPIGNTPSVDENSVQVVGAPTKTSFMQKLIEEYDQKIGLAGLSGFQNL